MRPRRAAGLARRAVALALGVAVAASAASAAADVVRTTDGLVLEGRVERRADGTVAVTTADGLVVLTGARVAAVEAGDGPRAVLDAELARLPAADVDGRYRLALRAEAAGAPGVARDALESVLAVAPDHAAARRALGYEVHEGRWLPRAEARRARGLVLFEGAWRLPAEVEAAAGAPLATVPADASLATVMRTAATGEPALARAAAVRLLAVAAPTRVATAKALLADAEPRVRAWACEHLAAAGDEAALRALVFSGVRDVDPAVRAAAVTAAAAFGHDDVAAPFAKALGSEHPGLVRNAAVALAALGDARAVGAIVRRLSSHGGGARSVVEFLNKVSYIRDYDVEIAQAANIANPVIGTAVEGQVFDVRVLDVGIERTVIETALVDAFNRLTGHHARDAREVLELYRARPTTVTWDFPKDPASVRRAAPPPRAATPPKG